MMAGCEQVGAYVVDALTDAERDAFVAHLASCDSCPREIREFSETTAALATMVAVAPPAGLRAQVLAQVAQVRPLPPLDTDPRRTASAASANGQPTPITVTVPRFAGSPVTPVRVTAADPAAAAGAGTGNVVDLDQRRHSRRGFLRWGVAAAAVGVVGLGAAGTISGWRAANDRNQAIAAQKELLAAPDAELVAFSPSAGNDVKGSYLVSRQQNKGMFIAERMPKLPEGKVFQQWTIAGQDAPAPNVTFDTITEAIWLTGDLAKVGALAISIENTGGATTPTQTTILGTAKL